MSLGSVRQGDVLEAALHQREWMDVVEFDLIKVLYVGTTGAETGYAFGRNSRTAEKEWFSLEKRFWRTVYVPQPLAHTGAQSSSSTAAAAAEETMTAGTVRIEAPYS